MKIVKMKADNKFALAPLSFKDIKIIKEACKLYSTQGSPGAARIYQSIEKELENVEV